MLNCFALAQAKSPSAEPGLHRVCEHWAQTALNHSPFRPDRVTIENPDQQPIAFLSMELEPSALGRGRTVVNEEGALLMDGLPYGFGPARRISDLAARLGHFLKGKDLDEAHRLISGHWSLIRFDPERGLQALSDHSSAYPLFWGENRDWLVIANRPGLVHSSLTLGGPRSPNTAVFTELLANRNLWGEETAWQGVSLLRPGHRLGCDLKGQVALQRSRHHPAWPSQSLRSMPPAERHDYAWEGLKAHWHELADTLDGDLPVGLTGGFDSRLVLAGAMGAGLHERLRPFTWGDDQLPDVLVANKLIKHFQLQRGHVPNESGVISTWPEFWDRLRFHVRLYGLSFCPWDALLPPLRHADITPQACGFFAPAFKPIGKHYSETDFHNPKQLKHYFKTWQGQPDPMGIIKKTARREYERSLETRVNRYLDSVPDPELIPVRAYLESRQALWCGAVNSGRTEQFRLIPLADRRVAEAAFCQSKSEREEMTVHFELMWRCEQSLLTQAFAGDEWPKATQERFPQLMFSSPLRPSEALKASATRPPKWQLLNENLKEIAAFLLDDTHSPLFDIVDREKLTQWLQETGFPSKLSHAKTLLSLIAIQIWLKGDELDDWHKFGAGEIRYVTDASALPLKGR